MKAKTFKKTIAAVMALAFLSGAANVTNGGITLFDTAITANAEDESTYTFTYNEETNEAVISGVLPKTGYSVSELMDLQFKVKKVVFKENTVMSEDCSWMFNTFTNLETVDLRGADLSKVKNTEFMFTSCRKLQNVYFTDTDLSSVTSMHNMFDECSGLVNVKGLTASSTELKDISELFKSCYSLTNVDLSGLNTENVTDVSGLFYECTSLKEADLRYLNTENVTDFSYMFYYCGALESVDLSNTKTVSAVNMKEMFSNCNCLSKLDLRSFETSNVQDMSRMFEGCVSLVSLDVSRFRTQNVKDLTCMFSSCYSLEKLDLANFDTLNATDMKSMFSYCVSLRELDIRRFVIPDSADEQDMFSGTNSLRKIKIGYGINKLELPNANNSKYGWVNENTPDTVASVADGDNTVIENSGENTYIKNQCKGHINGIGVNINTDGTLGLRVAVSLPDDLTAEEKASAKVEFYPDNAEGYEIVPVKRGKDGNYYAVHSILAKSMTDEYFINLKVNGNNVDSAYHSVRQYANKILTNINEYPEEQNLVKTMLLYGGAAQRKFDYHIYSYRKELMADHGITYTSGGLNYERKFFGPKGTGAAMGAARYVGSSIVLGSGVVQRHYIDVHSEKLDQFTFEVDGKKVTPTKKSNDLYYVDAVKNASMMKLDIPSEIIVYRNDDPNEKMSLEYSVMDYVVTLREKVSADSADYSVVENLSRLAKEAKEYLNK